MHRDLSSINEQNDSVDTTSNRKVPHNVEDTLAKILPSEDVLDRPEFDACEFINRNFPDEQSLEDISDFVIRLRGRMKELDDSLSQASQEQSLVAHQALVDLKEAKVASQQLFHKIKDIRGKAEQSEIMVQEICRDIKQLDYAKHHLQTTLTALKRLHMLVNAVDQLEYMSSQRNYREAATLLEAVNQLYTHFDGYTNVSKIVELHKTVRTLQEELGEQIFADFRSIGPMECLEENFTSHEERQAVFANLSAACAVVNALGKGTREKLIQLFCGEQLMSYEKLYGNGGECSGLQHAETRYMWFYNLLTAIEDRVNAVFPIHWRMAQRLCIYFCEITRNHLLAQIGAQTPEELDVTLLLKCLQRTLMFERDAAHRFEGPADNKDSEGIELNKNGEVIDPHSAEGIKVKYRREKQEVMRKALEEDMMKNGTLSNHNTEELPTIRGLVSRSFDPFMTVYVSLERKNMAQMINEITSAELVDRNGQLPVFSSSVNMFAYIRNSIKRCLALTNGQTFFDLHIEFKRCFQLYSQRLHEKLPVTSTGPSDSLESSSIGTHKKIKLSEKQVEELCFVINTAEYCAETLPSLEEVIRAKIDTAFSEAIELSHEIDSFHDVGTHAMKCIVSGLESLLDDDLAALLKINWQSWEAVGDESSYVTQMGEKLQTYVPVLRQMLSGLYFNNFCDKFATTFVPKILQAVLKCRKINQVATQQLLLDVYALKTLFLQLPVLIKDDVSPSITSTTTIPSRYVKFVTKEMAIVENVLKLIGTPNEMLVESFKIMWPDGTAEDFQSIMVIKGLKKSEQIAYLETLGMQRKPTGKIAEMEGKVSDMTENWRKNMQSLAKVPFTFTSGMNHVAH
ncbi:vacuolar protein sorting-associated protein 53 [Plasmopara halstedii]|uniref:Vacuolar protein sorting-associated protein 53 n=1 Tax=Plasmopara halstedii TaxID=4781 RepID=A0A0P1AXL1_PLAHL|nr:vacuolar protein sorting-associated protein 53 [Plasmopara halstedii]CEG46053.1 vacuolar protein sorting-associated protein 53 [Plasmopara halstedii]|eukprot:XP_024582422.1 vacuolar protein sorting-associated protein 53 [Plasmopara halstedii]